MQHSFASAGSAAAGFMVALALVSCGASGAHRTPDDGVKALIAGASSYGLPEFPEQGRLRVPGDARCVLRRMQTAMVGGKPHTLVGVYAAFDAHCSDGAVFLAVYATPSPDEQGFAADRLIEVSGAATDLVVRAYRSAQTTVVQDHATSNGTPTASWPSSWPSSLS